jgi:hypothetical protein
MESWNDRNPERCKTRDKEALQTGAMEVKKCKKPERQKA